MAELPESCNQSTKRVVCCGHAKKNYLDSNVDGTYVVEEGHRRKVGTIDPNAATKVQPELMSGEIVHWAGMPNPGIIFHSDDWSSIPFSLLCGGFFIFWEAGALGYWGDGEKNRAPSMFMVIWGIPLSCWGNT